MNRKPGLRRAKFALLCAGAVIWPGQRAASQEVLTNDAVVKMVQARLGAEVIVEQIRANAGNYTLTTGALIELKQKNVPDAVISAMQTKRTVANAGGASETSTTQAPDMGSLNLGETQETWRIRNEQDRMTGKTEQVLAATVRGYPKGVFEVQASCDEDVALFLAFFNRTQGLALKRTPVSQTVKTHERLDESQEATIGPPQSCAMVRYRVGQGPVQDMVSRVCDSDQYAAVDFLGNVSRQAARMGQNVNTVVNAVSSGPDDRGAAMGRILFGGLTAMMSQSLSKMPDVLAAVGVSRMSDVLAAPVVRTQLAFTNGESSTFDIHPRNAVFAEYMSRCKGPATATGPARAADGYRFRNGAAPTFRGTLNGFIAALPGYVQREAQASGMGQRDYSREIAAIVETARACAKSAAELSENFGSPRYGNLRVRLGCYDHSVSPRSPPSHGGRGLQVAVQPLYAQGPYRGNWQSGFRVRVSFEGGRADLSSYLQANPGLNPVLNTFVPADAYSIVLATVGDTLPDTKDGFKYVSAIPLEERKYEGTVDGFLQKAPEFLSRAVAAAGLKQEEYGADVTDQIARQVRRCTDANFLEHYPNLCSGGISVVAGAAITGVRGLRERIIDGYINAHGGIAGHSLTVNLYFRPQETDMRASSIKFTIDEPDTPHAEEYGIVFATLH